jgi:hypothetical protein
MENLILVSIGLLHNCVSGYLMVPLTAYTWSSTFFYLVCESIGTAATPSLLCQSRVIVKVIVEKQMECRLTGETEVLGKTSPSATFVHHKIPHDHTRV